MTPFLNEASAMHPSTSPSAARPGPKPRRALRLLALAVLCQASAAYALSPPANLRIGTGGGTPTAWPSASNTGWQPTGVTLKASGSLTVSTAGAVVDGLDVSGTIYVSANNVTIKRSRVRASAFAAIQIRSGVTGVRVEDCEIDGRGTSGGATNSMGVIGPVTVLRSNIYGVENGVTPESGSLVQDSYIHDLGAPGSPHYDGIQIDGGLSNIVVRHNNIVVSQSQTSAVMIDNYFGPTSNITVDNNRLVGGGFTVYSDGQFGSSSPRGGTGGTISGVSFTNNRLGKGSAGYANIVKNTPAWSGNVDDATGQSLGTSVWWTSAT
jgi:hypothetical protein